MEKPRFKAKTYGWGWQPATWQGWLVMLGWMVIDVGLIWALYLRYGTDTTFVAYVIAVSFVSAGGLVAVCALTGEKPRWQWGEKRQPPTRPGAS